MNTFIKELLHKNISSITSGNNRAKVPLHASDLTNSTLEFCPREYALVDMHSIQYPPETVGTSMRITWEYGNFIEYNVRNTWLRDHVYGNWECSVCETRHIASTYPEFETCIACNENKWVYKEMVFTSEHYGVSGSIDMLVRDPNDVTLLHVVELKTIDKDAFRELTTPKEEHVLRTNVYLELINYNQSQLLRLDNRVQYRINTDYAYIVYFSKSYGFFDNTVRKYDFHDTPFSPIKEFIITRDDTLTYPYWYKARTFKLYQENGTMPERICSVDTCTRAKNCVVREQCFSM